MDLKSKIILISGPTASGKSNFAIKLAKKINGEIINADSMQVYKELRILTARPKLKEQKKKLYGWPRICLWLVRVHRVCLELWTQTITQRYSIIVPRYALLVTPVPKYTNNLIKSKNINTKTAPAGGSGRELFLY